MNGQRDLYNDDAKQRFERALSLGATYELACAAAGWSYRAYRTWMVAAEQDSDDPHADLPDIVARARAARTQRWLASIEKAAQVDWKAAAWKLERCEREHYGREASVFLSGPAGGAIQMEVKHAQDMSDEELKAIAGED